MNEPSRPAGLPHGEHPHDYGYPMSEQSPRQVAEDLFAQAVAQGLNAPFGLDCEYWGRQYADKLKASGFVPVPDEQAIERAAGDLEAEVTSRNEWYGLDNWTFREVVEFVAASLHPELPKAQHGQEDTNAEVPPQAQ